MASDQSENSTNAPRLQRKLSMLGIWALSFGCSVGWGSFVMPGNTFLPMAGPLGTVIGIVIGALIMLVISVSYSYLVNRFPDAGGTFTYTKTVFGYDHGFLSAWFLGLVYLAIIWANATAIPLIFRNLFPENVVEKLQFGYCYTIAGYPIYISEILLSVAAILLCGFICTRGGKLSAVVQTVMAVALIVCVVICFAAVFLNHGESEESGRVLEPLFSESNSPVTGILFIVFLAPWAYAGFESVSHSAEEFRFSHKKTFRILAIGLLTSAVAYSFLALIAATWKGGGSGLPVFSKVSGTLGTPGTVILGIAAASAILTGLLGNMFAASRLLFSMSRDNLLPASMGKLNKKGVPSKAVLFLVLVSLPIPFFGRSATGWIIDVNTIGIVIAYAYTSAAALKASWKEKRTGVRIAGFFGIAVSVFFLFYFLIPNSRSGASLSTESYLMLVLWAVLGFAVFYMIFRKDKGTRIGHHPSIWIVLLLLIFLSSTLWVVGTTKGATDSAVAGVTDIYKTGTGATEEAAESFSSLLRNSFNNVSGTIIRNTIIQFAVILFSIVIIFITYSAVRKKHSKAEEGKIIAEHSSHAKTTFLSNMSHDIRTPVNAIVGYVTLAKREKNLSQKSVDYLNKIEASSAHLLSLINDVLEMSRIESGKMELMPVPTDMRVLMQEVKDLFSTQMEAKKLNYDVRLENVIDANVLCDKNRFNRVLLNLISNAYKFTPEGGSVTVTLREQSREGTVISYILSVKDTGIGMSPEFAAKVFEAYERERTATVENIQGTGLGTAITKSIVDLMGGTIEVFSEQGKGSEFVVRVGFEVDPEADAQKTGIDRDRPVSELEGRRLLLVEDDPDNLDVEKTLLEEAGFEIEIAENGEEAVELIASSEPGYYACVLMDIEMPVKNGYEAARLIRSLKNQELAEIPIVAVTAKAFGEDITLAKNAGINGHVAKPVNLKTLLETLSGLIK